MVWFRKDSGSGLIQKKSFHGFSGVSYPYAYNVVLHSVIKKNKTNKNSQRSHFPQIQFPDAVQLYTKVFGKSVQLLKVNLHHEGITVT